MGGQRGMLPRGKAPVPYAASVYPSFQPRLACVHTAHPLLCSPWGRATQRACTTLVCCRPGRPTAPAEHTRHRRLSAAQRGEVRLTLPLAAGPCNVGMSLKKGDNGVQQDTRDLALLITLQERRLLTTSETRLSSCHRQKRHRAFGGTGTSESPRGSRPKHPPHPACLRGAQTLPERPGERLQLSAGRGGNVQSPLRREL